MLQKEDLSRVFIQDYCHHLDLNTWRKGPLMVNFCVNVLIDYNVHVDVSGPVVPNVENFVSVADIDVRVRSEWAKENSDKDR